MSKPNWEEYLRIERITEPEHGYEGYGIFTLSHNECVGKCLTEESAEYHSDLIAQEMAPKLTRTKHTEAETITWMNSQRRIYAEGRLSADKVQKLESIPGWTWIQTATL